MGAVIGIVAAVIALVGVIVALGHVGYLAMLRNAAKERGASGAATLDYVNGRWKAAGGTALVALLGLLLTSGGVAAGHPGPADRRRRRAGRQEGARLDAGAVPGPH